MLSDILKSTKFCQLNEVSLISIKPSFILIFNTKLIKSPNEAICFALIDVFIFKFLLLSISVFKN